MPKEVVREVIKEVIKEVPVEVPVEVSAHLAPRRHSSIIHFGLGAACAR